MKIAKRIVTLLCAFVLCFISGGDALAASKSALLTGKTSGNISIQWVNTALIDISLSFDGGKALCGVIVVGQPDTNQISAMVKLERKNSNGTYTEVKTWSGLSAADDMLIVDKSYYVTKGYTYRLSVTAIVYRYGYGEVVSGSFENYCPN